MGYDAAQKVKGRKRHLLVDALGLIVKAVVQPANVQDRDGARELLQKAKSQAWGIRHLWADAGYRATVSWIEQELGWSVDIVTRLADTVGVAVQLSKQEG